MCALYGDICFTESIWIQSPSLCMIETFSIVCRIFCTHVIQSCKATKTVFLEEWEKFCISVFRQQRLLWLEIFTENLHFDRSAKVVMTCERASLHDHWIVSAMLPGNVLFFWNEVTFCFNCNVLIGSWVTFFGIDRRRQWLGTGQL